MRPNHLKYYALLTGIIGLALLASASFAAQKMPAGSYLSKPAPTAAALNIIVASDKKAVERYSRLFRMSPERVRSAFKELYLTKMTRDQIVRVYYVHPDEHLGYRLRRIRKGTPVFALPDGTPALIQVCGNPMRPDLKYNRVLGKHSRGGIPDFTPEDAQEQALLDVEDVPITKAYHSADLEGAPAAEIAARAVEPDDQWSSVETGGFVEDAGALPRDFVPSSGGFGSSGGGNGLNTGLLLTGLAGLTQWLAGGGSGNYYGNSPSIPGPPGGGTSGGGNSGSGGSGGTGSGTGSGGGGNNGITSVVPETDALTLIVTALLGMGGVQLILTTRARRKQEQSVSS